MNHTHESFAPTGDAAVEARIVAWVLGETSASESADLERICDDCPELSAFRSRINALHQSLIHVEATAAESTWTLPPAKRRLLDQIFNEKPTVSIDEKISVSGGRPKLRTVLAIAACLTLAAVMLRTTDRVSVSRVTSIALERGVDLVQATGKESVGNATTTRSSTANRTDEIYNVDSMVMSKNRDSGLQATTRQRQLAAKNLVETSDQIIATAPFLAPNLADTITRFSSVMAVSGAPVEFLSGSGMGLGLAQTKAVWPSIDSPNHTSAECWFGSTIQMAHNENLNGKLLSSPTLSRKNTDVTLEGHSRRTAAALTEGRSADSVGTMAPNLPEKIPAAVDRYSTFPFNCGDVSFQLAKAALANGIRPNPNTIQLEQFYNAVDYDDPAPVIGDSVAVTTEQSTHPFLPSNNLVRVALRIGSTNGGVAEPIRLTVLVDQSGSVRNGGHGLSIARALTELTGLLTKNDLITVVAGSRTPHLLAYGVAGDQSSTFANLLEPKANENEIDLEKSIKFAGEMATRSQLAGARNRVVLFTDGAKNPGVAGDLDRLSEQVNALRQQGIFFDIVDTGVDALNNRLLDQLAGSGGGRCYFFSSENASTFAKQFVSVFRPSVENVKVVVKFNPHRVGKYKLLGFEHDRLDLRDPKNGAINPRQSVADGSGVAMYQVESILGGSGDVGEVNVYFRDPVTNEMTERTWPIGQQSPPVAFHSAAPSMQLAGLSLLAAEKLCGGPSSEVINFNQLTGPILRVKKYYGNRPPVVEMLQVIDKLK